MKRLTVAELAAFLGVTASAVRQVVRRNGIASVGKMGRAKLYDPRTVLDACGAHDRRACQDPRPSVTLDRGDRIPWIAHEDPGTALVSKD